MATLTAEATLNAGFNLTSGYHIASQDVNRTQDTEFRKAVAFRRSNTTGQYTETNNWESALDLDQYQLKTAYIEADYHDDDYFLEYNETYDRPVYFNEGTITPVFDFCEFIDTTKNAGYTEVNYHDDDYFSFEYGATLKFTATLKNASNSIITIVSGTHTTTQILNNSGVYSVPLNDYTYDNGFVYVSITSDTTDNLGIHDLQLSISATGRTHFNTNDVITKTHKEIVNRLDARPPAVDTIRKDTVLRFSDLEYTFPNFPYGIGGIVNYFGTQDNDRSASTTAGRAQALEDPEGFGYITINDNDFDGLSTGNLDTKLNSFQIGSSLTRNGYKSDDSDDVGSVVWKSNLFDTVTNALNGLTFSAWFYMHKSDNIPDSQGFTVKKTFLEYGLNVDGTSISGGSKINYIELIDNVLTVKGNFELKITFPEMPAADDSWHHIAFSWNGKNGDDGNIVINAYLDDQTPTQTAISNVGGVDKETFEVVQVSRYPKHNIRYTTPTVHPLYRSANNRTHGEIFVQVLRTTSPGHTLQVGDVVELDIKWPYDHSSGFVPYSGRTVSGSQLLNGAPKTFFGTNAYTISAIRDDGFWLEGTDGDWFDTPENNYSGSTISLWTGTPGDGGKIDAPDPTFYPSPRLGPLTARQIQSFNENDVYVYSGETFRKEELRLKIFKSASDVVSGGADRTYLYSTGDVFGKILLDNDYIDLSINTNLQQLKNANDLAPTSIPQINGVNPKIFIDVDNGLIKNVGTGTQDNRLQSTLTPIETNVFNPLVRNELLSNEIQGLVGGSPFSVISEEPDIYDASIDTPVILFSNHINNATITQDNVNNLDIELKYIHPPIGAFENTFIKSRLTLKLRLTSGDIDLPIQTTLDVFPAVIKFATPEDLDISLTSTFAGGFQLLSNATLENTFTLDSDVSVGLFSEAKTFPANFDISITGNPRIKDLQPFDFALNSTIDITTFVTHNAEANLVSTYTKNLDIVGVVIANAITFNNTFGGLANIDASVGLFSEALTIANEFTLTKDVFVGIRDIQTINLQNNITTNFRGGFRVSVEPQLDNIFTAEFNGGLILDKERADFIWNFATTQDILIVLSPNRYRMLILDAKTRNYVINDEDRIIKSNEYTRNIDVNAQTRIIDQLNSTRILETNTENRSIKLNSAVSRIITQNAENRVVDTHDQTRSYSVNEQNRIITAKSQASEQVELLLWSQTTTWKDLQTWKTAETLRVLTIEGYDD